MKEEYIENLELLNHEPKAVLFDLDGTLIESFASVRDTLVSALLYCGYEPPAGNVYGELFGRSEHDVFVKLGFPEEKIPALMDEWTRFTSEYTGDIPYYEGIPELLQSLRQQGCALGIITGRNRKTTRTVPVALELEKIMDVFVNPDDTCNGKPDPEPVFFALKKIGFSPDQTIYVGDSANDITMANAAGCTSILVTWGGVKDATGFTSQPDYIVSTVEELKIRLLGLIFRDLTL
jgi:HAD superfamily hydrolase (TIGR01549 family)